MRQADTRRSRRRWLVEVLVGLIVAFGGVGLTAFAANREAVIAGLAIPSWLFLDGAVVWAVVLLIVLRSSR